MSATNDNNNPNSTIIIKHLSRLADSIFALAMGLTVLGFKLPETATSMTDTEVNNFLLAQLNPLVTYLSTFLLVAFYWIDHTQQFAYYRKTNTIQLWFYVMYLMCLLIVPCSNALIVYFSNNSTTKILFSLNIFLIGIFSFIIWSYATNEHRLVDANLDKRTIRATKIKSLIEPLFSLLTIVVALFNQSLWDYVWFLIIIPYIFVEKFLDNPLDNPATIASAEGEEEAALSSPSHPEFLSKHSQIEVGNRK